jgi:hypothetical protein|nr:hypothetical protein Q903MT_gene6621 [Picea sitchensis]
MHSFTYLRYDSLTEAPSFAPVSGLMNQSLIPTSWLRTGIHFPLLGTCLLEPVVGGIVTGEP